MKANCKINLQLKVVGKREDGYHLLDMYMQEIDLFDKITITRKNTMNINSLNTFENSPNLSQIIYKNNHSHKKENSNTINNKKSITLINDNITINKESFLDENNLIIKCAKKLSEKYNLPFDEITFNLQKNVPVSAGLGGGSSDCANAIIQINNLFRLNLSKEEMLEIAESLGADVPFFLEGGLKHCKGIGEKITKCKYFPIESNNLSLINVFKNNQYFILLITPNVYVSTPEIFQSYDEKIKNSNSTHFVLKYHSDLINELSQYAINKHPIIEELILKLKSLNCLEAQMSGSGPTVFGIYNDIEKAKFDKMIISTKYSNLIRYIGIHNPII